MRLEKEERGRCEMGKCKNKANYCIRMDRAGIKSRICICSDCLTELYRVIGGAFVPRSIETVRKKNEQ